MSQCRPSPGLGTDPLGFLKVLGMLPGSASRLGICLFLRILFQTNEGLPYKRKLTDEKLQEIVCQKFPTSALARKKTSIAYYRKQYNHNMLGLEKRPERRSRRYTADGELATKRGKTLIPTEMRLTKGQRRDVKLFGWRTAAKRGMIPQTLLVEALDRGV